MDMEFYIYLMEECTKEPGSPIECMEKVTRSYPMDRNIWFIQITVKEWTSLRSKKKKTKGIKTFLLKIIKNCMIN